MKARSPRHAGPECQSGLSAENRKSEMSAVTNDQALKAFQVVLKWMHPIIHS